MATEKRLIDVNKVIDEMQKCIDESAYARDSIASYTFGAIIECLKREPTVDAVEVVHGRWRIIDFKGNVECSECGYTMDLEYKFCPNCGAKMDGDGNGT